MSVLASAYGLKDHYVAHLALLVYGYLAEVEHREHLVVSPRAATAPYRYASSVYRLAHI